MSGTTNTQRRGWRVVTVPFAEKYELNEELSATLTSKNAGWNGIIFPGRPRLNIRSSSPGIREYLASEFMTPDLDRLAPRLWLMTTQSSAHISPLHHQYVKGRTITVTEDPSLHLVWFDNRIFIKPLPAFLLSYVFWTSHLLGLTQETTRLSEAQQEEQDGVIRAASGFLRTYACLIRYPSDFRIAVDHGLVPSTITYDRFSLFSMDFPDIPDAAVSPRYSFGEIRLSRLNFWSKIFLGRWHYLTVHRQYGAYFQRFFAPLLFLFGSLSVILGALQVEMAVEAMTDAPWAAVKQFSRYFSVVSIFVTALLCAGLLFLLVGKLLMELVYATKDKLKRRMTSCSDA